MGVGKARAVMVAFTLVVGLLTGGMAQADERSVVIDWVEEMLSAIEQNPPAPTATTWRMDVVASSMYDAWAAYDPEALGTQMGADLRRPPGEHTEANQAEAVSYAAYRALTFVFPNQEPQFATQMKELEYPLSDSTDVTTPAGVGNVAAQAVIDYRVNDGANALGGFTQIMSDTYPELYQPVNSPDHTAPNAPGGADFDPNRWQPLRVPTGTLLDANGNPYYENDVPGSYVDQTFLTPHWGAVVPFALSSGDQFRPPGPPQYGSVEPYVDGLGNETTNDQAWVDQINEIKDHNAALDDRKKVIAEFWADGPTTWTPPGHWVQIAMGLARRDGHGIGEDVRMYLALTGALLDGGIVAWEAKRQYDYIRPISAIRNYYYNAMIEGWAGPNQGTQMIQGKDWQPYQSPTFVTPPFAEFVSGHSTFSRAAREVLFAYMGSDALYDGCATKLGHDFDGDGVEDCMGRHIVEPGHLMFEDGPAETVVLVWDTMLEAADEAALSRRYGGIHIQDGDLRAREMGRQVGQQAIAWAPLYWDPFGTLGGMVDEATDGGLQRSLLASLRAADRAFDRGNDDAGCGSLDAFQNKLDAQRGKGLSESDYRHLDRGTGLVADLLCAR